MYVVITKTNEHVRILEGQVPGGNLFLDYQRCYPTKKVQIIDSSKNYRHVRLEEVMDYGIYRNLVALQNHKGGDRWTLKI